MRITFVIMTVFGVGFLSGCFLGGRYEEKELWSSPFSQGNASIIYRGHYGLNDGELLLRWSDLYGRLMGEVRLIYLDEYPGELGFKGATIHDKEQSVSVAFLNYQGKAQITIPLVVAGTDVRHLTERNRAPWINSNLENIR